MEDRWICVCWKWMTDGWSIYPYVSCFRNTHIYPSIIYIKTKFHQIIFFLWLTTKMIVYSFLVLILRLKIFPELSINQLLKNVFILQNTYWIQESKFKLKTPNFADHRILPTASQIHFKYLEERFIPSPFLSLSPPSPPLSMLIYAFQSATWAKNIVKQHWKRGKGVIWSLR